MVAIFYVMIQGAWLWQLQTGFPNGDSLVEMDTAGWAELLS